MAGCQKPISYSLHLSGIVTAEVVDAQTKAPLVKGGCLGTAEAGGFRRQSLRNFLPIPSSLFPKKPSPFHMSLYFGKVPTVNPSVTAYAVPAPFNKGAFGWGIVSLQKISQISPAPGELWAFFPGLYGEIQEKCLGFG